MARTAKPWYYQQTGWWMAWIDGEKVKLAEGKKNCKQAQDRLDELRYEAARNPCPEDTQQTVASVIERYIEVVFPGLRREPPIAVAATCKTSPRPTAGGWSPPAARTTCSSGCSLIPPGRVTGQSDRHCGSSKRRSTEQPTRRLFPTTLSATSSKAPVRLARHDLLRVPGDPAAYQWQPQTSSDTGRTLPAGFDISVVDRLPADRTGSASLVRYRPRIEGDRPSKSQDDQNSADAEAAWDSARSSRGEIAGLYSQSRRRRTSIPIDRRPCVKIAINSEHIGWRNALVPPPTDAHPGGMRA